MIKSVGDISNFRNLALENCRLINCQDIFEAQYSKRIRVTGINDAEIHPKITGNYEKLEMREKYAQNSRNWKMAPDGS